MILKKKTFEKPEVAAVFTAYPKQVRTKLMFLRQLIFETAFETEGVGKLEEALKWGQPSYLTTKSQSGSTIRIDQVKSHQGAYGIYFNCQTTLVDTFREIYRDQFKFEGNRSIIFNESDVLPVEELKHCILMALTYHRNKK